MVNELFNTVALKFIVEHSVCMRPSAALPGCLGSDIHLFSVEVVNGVGQIFTESSRHLGAALSSFIGSANRCVLCDLHVPDPGVVRPIKHCLI